MVLMVKRHSGVLEHPFKDLCRTQGMYSTRLLPASGRHWGCTGKAQQIRSAECKGAVSEPTFLVPWSGVMNLAP